VELRALEIPLARDLAEQARQTLKPQSDSGAGEEYFLRGSRLLDEGEASGALPLLEQAVQLRPSQSSWWLTLAQARAELQQWEAARQAANQALKSAANETERKAAQAFAAMLTESSPN
jgi:tetratricopeptide (TPR) repeat protein